MPQLNDAPDQHCFPQSFRPPIKMSHADRMRWCNQSHSVELNSLLTRLDAASFTAVAAYTAAVFVAVFFLLRWYKLSASNKNELWNGFKL